jgi:hypothetical protein
VTFWFCAILLMLPGVSHARINQTLLPHSCPSEHALFLCFLGLSVSHAELCFTSVKRPTYGTPWWIPPNSWTGVGRSGQNNSGIQPSG